MFCLFYVFWLKIDSLIIFFVLLFYLTIQLFLIDTYISRYLQFNIIL